MKSIVETQHAASLHFFVFLQRYCNVMRKRFCFILFAMLIVFGAKAQNDTVLFSVQGGIYDNVFALRLSNTNPQNHIRYTTNGNCPTAQSPRYEGAMTLNASMFSKSNIYTINNTIPSQFYLPNDVKRGIVIRAAAFDQNDSCVSQVVSNSYFIRSLDCDLHGMPVLSIMADSLSLFDYETGIFIPGALYDPADSTHTGNYRMKGIEWERQINLEFYESGNGGINQLCGLRMHGNASRWFQQKGMKLYAREEYGKKHFFYRFFPGSPIVKFKHLILHPFRCSNWLQTGGQEYLSQTIAANLDIEAMAVREVVVFINGEYWGIYTLEESSDERYLKDHFNADLEKLNMIKYWGVPYYGDLTDWRSLYYWMKNEADLTQPEDSAYAFEHVDMSNFVDYVLFETFSANLDWPGNNVKIWQPEAGKPFRWIFYDGDGCFTRPEFNAIDFAQHQGGNSVFFNHFRENEWFVRTFRNRYYQLRESCFSYDYMKSVLDGYASAVEGEIESQAQRFRFPRNVTRWQQDMEQAYGFIQQRDQYYKEELLHYLDVEEIASTNVSCYPNPFADEVRLRYPFGDGGAHEVVIYDVLGRKVFSQACDAESDAEITIKTDLPAGVYVLKVGALTQRIVKY
jgi:hypothetical protein